MKKMMLILLFLSLGLIGCADHGASSESVIRIDQSDFLEADLTLGEFTILEGFHGFPGDRSDALTLEEAATIGATYVLNVFRNPLAGMYMELTFNYNPHISRSTWIGNIAYSPEDFGGEIEGFLPALLVFSIDALTGERISIINHSIDPLHEMADLWMMSEDERWELFPEPDEEEMELMMEIAHNFAQRHFAHELIINIELGIYLNGVTDSAYFPSPDLFFVATDSEGRIVQIMIQRGTMQLLSIHTPLEILAPNVH